LNENQNRLAQRFLARKGTGIMAALMGARNTGKTQVALYITSKYKSYIYTTAMRFFLGLADSFGSNTRISYVDNHLNKELLIVDEAHLKGETEWADRVMQFLFDEAYRKRIDTIVIANAAANEFEKLFGDSIARRFEESGGIVDCSKWPTIPKTVKDISPVIFDKNKQNEDDWQTLFKYENEAELKPEVKFMLRDILQRLGRGAIAQIDSDYLKRIVE
jgi:DNA replication protein DnaC